MPFTDLREGVLEVFVESCRLGREAPEGLVAWGLSVHQNEYHKAWRRDRRAARAISEGRPVGRPGRPPKKNPSPALVKERAYRKGLKRRAGP